MALKVSQDASCLRLAVSELPTDDSILEYRHNLLTAVMGFANQNGAADSATLLANAISALRQAEADVLGSHAHRPTTARRRAVLEALRLALSAWPVFEQMLSAPSMGKAQYFAADGQRILDEVTHALSRYLADAAAAAAFENSDASTLFERALALIEVNHPGSNILDLSETTASRASRTLGIPVATSLGVEYAILEVVANSVFDSVRFADVLAQSAAFVHGHPLLASVAASEGALDGLAESRRLLAEAIMAFESSIRHETNEQTIVRRLIRLHGEVYEHAPAPLYAWYLLLAEAKNKSFKKLIADDGANALGAAVGNSGVLSPWFLGNESFLRNAALHSGGFSLSTDTVLFSLRSYVETHTTADVINTVLLNFESLAAASWSLSNALSLAGIEVPLTDDDASYMGITQVAITEIALAHLGHTGVVSIDGDVLHVRLEDAAANAFQLAIAISTSAGNTARVVVVSSPVGDAESIEFSIESYKSFAASEGNAVVRMIEFRHACRTVDGSVLTVEDLRYALACLGIPLLIHNDLPLIPLIRRLKVVALNAGFDGCIRDIGGVFAALREDNDRATREVTSQLNEWLTNPPEVPSAKRVSITNPELK